MKGKQRLFRGLWPSAFLQKGLLFCGLFCSLVCCSSVLWAQSLPVGLLDRSDDYYRRAQLLGADSLKSSLMIRPLHQSTLAAGADSLGGLNRLLARPAKGLAIYALPLVWVQQINSHHPYGTNDGLMIPAKGYQTLFSAGVYAEAGPLSIQLRPELVYAQNAAFVQSLDAPLEAKVLSGIKGYYNGIDAPERMGNGAYNQLSWGQSSIRLNWRALSFGLSNENLWWGPGVHNSLMMSNNAPGFKHLTFNTRRPIQTGIGSFEGQFVAGRLEASGYRDARLTVIKDDWRYLSGVVLSWQPKWVPGLFVGFDRTFTVYESDMGHKLGDYLPFFSSLSKKTYQTAVYENAEDKRKRDQIFSLFAKWVMPEAKAEMYIQYGKEDHSWDIRDIMVEPEHARAYIAGFRKLLPVKGSDHRFIQVGVELTQTESGSKGLRNGLTWYTHSQVKSGYTHKGQFLGAGGGPDNVQNLDIAWVDALKRIGFSFERRVHNNTLYYKIFNSSIEPRRHWVDLDFSGHFDWTYKHFMLNAELGYIHSMNYQYRVANQDPNVFWNFDPQDANNLHLRAGILYRW